MFWRIALEATMIMCIKKRYMRAMQEGLKTIEFRLFDDKRQGLRLGSRIRFVMSASTEDPDEFLCARVTGLLWYASFEKMVYDLPVSWLPVRAKSGYSCKMEMYALVGELYTIYPAEKQLLNGVIGIRFEVIDPALYCGV